MSNLKETRRKKIHMRVRKRVSGTPSRPRLAVFRSNTQIYAQIVDDTKGVTLFAASSREEGISEQKVTKIEQAKLVGELIARKAKASGLENIVFDRSGYLYHGRIKALADGAREGGLQF